MPNSMTPIQLLVGKSPALMDDVELADYASRMTKLRDRWKRAARLKILHRTTADISDLL